MEILLSNATLLITVLGALAFVVSVITQVTKAWGFLDKIPTTIQVYITSLVLTVLSVIIYLQFKNMGLVWYYIVGAVILSFFVAFVVTNGWDQLSELWKRYGKNKEEK